MIQKSFWKSYTYYLIVGDATNTEKVFAKEETKSNYFASISVLKAKIYSDLLSGCADV